MNLSKELKRISMRNSKTIIHQEDKIRIKIEKRFKGKQMGRLTFRLNDNTKLGIEYMYGGKFALKRKEKGKKAQSLIVMDSLDRVVKEILKQKYNNKNKIFNNLKHLIK